MLSILLFGFGAAHDAGSAWEPPGCHEAARGSRMKALRHQCVLVEQNSPAAAPMASKTRQSVYTDGSYASSSRQPLPAMRETGAPASQKVTEVRVATPMFCAGIRCRQRGFSVAMPPLDKMVREHEVVAIQKDAVIRYSTPLPPLPLSKPPVPQLYVRPSLPPAIPYPQPVYEEAEFADAQTVANDSLKEVRGGFLTSSGMMVDVGLITRTLVDGVLVEQTRVNIGHPGNIDPSSLQTLVQVDDNGATVSKLGLGDIPQIVNVIQNNQNNVVIDNAAILNVDVTNASSFTIQMQEPLFNHQLVQGLR